MIGEENNKPPTDARTLAAKEKKEMHTLGLFLAGLGEELGWLDGAAYTGHTIRLVDDGWLLVLRANKNRSNVVCFIGGRDPLECYRNLYWLMNKDALGWRPDKYA